MNLDNIGYIDDNNHIILPADKMGNLSKGNFVEVFTNQNGDMVLRKITLNISCNQK